MSTHYIEEAERLADTVLIMSHGQAVAAGPPAELIASTRAREALEVYGPPARLAEVEAEAAAKGLRTRRTGTSVAILGVETRTAPASRASAGRRTSRTSSSCSTGEEIG